MAKLLMSCGTWITVECDRIEARVCLEDRGHPGDWRTFAVAGAKDGERPVMVSVRRHEVVAILDDLQ